MADDSVAGSGHPLLNPGIVRTVAWLNSYGFGTSDGETHDFECDAPHPYVAIVVQPADLISETVRLVALLEAQGIEIKPIGEAPEGETPDWVEIQSTFDPAGMPGIIYLAHMHDRLLPDELVVVEEQPPPFFAEWSRPFYAEAVRRLHAAGKYVAVHIDGRLRGAIDMIRNTGADCGDAITPTPMGDLTPIQCRAEAGPNFILSGGVSPDLWLPGTPVDTFAAKVLEWLELRRLSPRLIANAGDQVPPGADQDRIRLMRDLVEKHGRY